jgi:hypothetical protein
VKPFYLSSKIVLPIKLNHSTYQVKPFYLSSETVLPFKIRLVPLQQLAWSARVRAVVARVPAENRAVRAFLERNAGSSQNTEVGGSSSGSSTSSSAPRFFKQVADDAAAPTFGAAAAAGAAGVEEEGGWVTYRFDLK